jgi:hypothetical protein
MRRVLIVAIAFVTLASCTGGGKLVIIPRSQLHAMAPSLYSSNVRSTKPGIARVRLYMVQGTRLVAVDREGPSTLSALELSMRELLKGPSPAETAKGITTNIPSSVQLRDVSATNGVATVDLSQDFELTTPDRPTFLLRLAQVVYTLTELSPTVQSVRFEVEGQPVLVLVQDGTLVAEPVARGRYTDYAPISSGAAVSNGPLT